LLWSGRDVVLCRCVDHGSGLGGWDRASSVNVVGGFALGEGFREKKGGTPIDQAVYNGWPNVFTWQVYACLSSSIETYDVARGLVSASSSLFEAADGLRDWLQEARDDWCEQCPEGAFKVLFTGVLNNAFGQVDWDHLAKAFDESS